MVIAIFLNHQSHWLNFEIDHIFTSKESSFHFTHSLPCCVNFSWFEFKKNSMWEAFVLINHCNSKEALP